MMRIARVKKKKKNEERRTKITEHRTLIRLIS